MQKKKQPGTVEKISRSSARNPQAFAIPVQCSDPSCFRLDFRHMCDFHWSLRYIYPSEFTLPRIKCHKINDLSSSLKINRVSCSISHSYCKFRIILIITGI